MYLSLGLGLCVGNWSSVMLASLLGLLHLLRLLGSKKLGVLPRACAGQCLLWSTARCRMHGIVALQHHYVRVVLNSHGPCLLKSEVRILCPKAVLQFLEL